MCKAVTCCCGYNSWATADFAGSDHFSIKEKQLLFKSSELASQTQLQISYASLDCIFVKASNLQIEVRKTVSSPGPSAQNLGRGWKTAVVL